MLAIVSATVAIGYSREYSAQVAADALRRRMHIRVRALSKSALRRFGYLLTSAMMLLMLAVFTAAQVGTTRGQDRVVQWIVEPGFERGVADDRVDPELVDRPRRWASASSRNFSHV